MGSPASWSVESCRVKVHNCLAPTLPNENPPFFFFLAAGFLASLSFVFFFRPSSVIFVTNRSWSRISCWASASDSASIVPVTSAPLWSIASYL